MTDGTKIMADQKPEDYKNKYDDLMKRCAEFMQEFAPPSPYELGFKAGWEAAKKEFHKDNTYVPDTTKPATTMDLQWPRDKMAWPWPPNTVVYQACGVCGIGGDINKAMSYVCNNPNCPTRVTCISTTGITT
jgi:hypothetical protein